MNFIIYIIFQFFPVVLGAIILMILKSSIITSPKIEISNYDYSELILSSCTNLANEKFDSNLLRNTLITFGKLKTLGNEEKYAFTDAGVITPETLYIFNWKKNKMPKCQPKLFRNDFKIFFRVLDPYSPNFGLFIAFSKADSYLLIENSG